MSKDAKEKNSEFFEEQGTSFILKKDIYDNNGTLLLAKGQAISMSTKRKLEDVGVFPIPQKKGNKVASSQASSTPKEAADKVLLPIIHSFGARKGIHTIYLTELPSRVLTSIVFESKEKPWWVLINAMIQHSEFLYTHSIDVAMLSLLLAEQLGYSEERQWNLALGAFLHDIGKFLLPEANINHSMSMTRQEKLHLQQHCEIGANSLKIFNLAAVCSEIVLHHHEHMDGSGYPQGLTGSAISQEAQIVMISDVFDNMTSEQVGWPTRTIEGAIQMLKSNQKKYPQSLVSLLEKIVVL